MLLLLAWCLPLHRAVGGGSVAVRCCRFVGEPDAASFHRLLLGTANLQSCGDNPFGRLEVMQLGAITGAAAITGERGHGQARRAFLADSLADSRSMRVLLADVLLIVLVIVWNIVL